MYQNDAMKVLTGEVRLSYAYLDKPYLSPNAKPGTEPKYSVTLLIPKNDAATKADIDASLQAAIQHTAAETWGGTPPPMLGTPKFQGHEYPKIGLPLYDGDGVRSSGEPFGAECKGHWVITASTKMKPQVVGIDNINVELGPNDIYSGMRARVTIRFFGYSNSGNKGVGCGLGNIMKTRDDEPLAGNASAASDFASVGSAVVQPQYPAAPAYAPAPAYQQPAAPSYQQPAQPMYQQPPAQPGAYPQQPAAPAPGYPQQHAVNINPLTGQPL